MRLHLYWRDKSWQLKSSAARNYNLIVDTDRKIYKSYINPFYGYQTPESIEVVKKSDIFCYIEYVKDLGFRESEQV